MSTPQISNVQADKEATTAKVGKVVFFVGQYSVNWQVAQFAALARTVRALGVDSLAIKCGDGSIRWYDSQGGIPAIKAAVMAEGCGFIPYQYCYGDKFGDLDGEMRLLAELMAINGCVCADLEAEYNGQVEWASRFNAAMTPVPGLLYLTSWADPNEQAWQGVTGALRGCVNAWVPQQYNTWLGHQEGELTALGESVIQPALDLSQEFGANDTIGLARDAAAHGHTTVWLWESGMLDTPPTPDTVRTIVGIMGGTPTPAPAPTPAPVVTPPPPTPTPAPTSGTIAAYTIDSGDTLSGIAAELHLANWYHDLYQPNMYEIEQAARDHGMHDSQQGTWIFPGTVLHYRVP